MADVNTNPLAQICSCMWHAGLRDPGIDCPVHGTPKPLTQRVKEGMRLRHAAVEQAIDKLGAARNMAYLSHLDRGELLIEIERLRVGIEAHRRDMTRNRSWPQLDIDHDLWALIEPQKD